MTRLRINLDNAHDFTGSFCRLAVLFCVAVTAGSPLACGDPADGPDASAALPAADGTDGANSAARTALPRPDRGGPGPSDPLAQAIAAIHSVGAEARGHVAAAKAWHVLASTEPSQLVELLAGMDRAGPLAANWIRAAVDSVAERAVAESRPIDRAALEGFLFDRAHDDKPRRLAFEWLVRLNPSAREALLDRMLDDPSRELRRDAVARVIDSAAAATGDDQTRLYRSALNAARDLDQVEACAEALKKLGQPIDLATQLGFIQRWYLVGPFDNTDQKGFDAPYPPEQISPEQVFDPQATYDGKLGKVQWIEYQTDDPHGVVDLTKALDKHKGAATYAAVRIESPARMPAQLRIGSINACKAWVNGRLVCSRETYHTGMFPDQYTSDVGLEPGNNIVLLKICQNEQEESWAQDWKFQMRVTDSLGGPLDLALSPRPVREGETK